MRAGVTGMTKPTLDGRIAKALATLMDEDAAVIQELIGEMIDAHALKQDTKFYLKGAAARKGISELRRVFDALADGDYRTAERLLGINVKD